MLLWYILLEILEINKLTISANNLFIIIFDKNDRFDYLFMVPIASITCITPIITIILNIHSLLVFLLDLILNYDIILLFNNYLFQYTHQIRGNFYFILYIIYNFHLKLIKIKKLIHRILLNKCDKLTSFIELLL